ncbi:MAG: hypothetical protein ISR64_00500 [Deltaproteobacteria bacterium]|nr:hypothetical protein [Deltaproteobacteria bacterium]
MKRVHYSELNAGLLAPAKPDPDVSKAVMAIFDTVESEGDDAVRRYAGSLDGPGRGSFRLRSRGQASPVVRQENPEN